MTTVDTREIRGLNLRIIITIVIATISIVSTVLITKDSLQSQIQDIRKDQSQFGQVNDLNFKIFDIRVKSFEARLDAVEKKVNEQAK